MSPRLIPFHLLIQPKDRLSGVQKYMLRMIFGRAGKTILHRDRLVEVIDTHAALRQLYPLMESDLSESRGAPFWIPRTPSASKKFEAEQKERRREIQERRLQKHPTIGIVWGSPRPKHTRRWTLRSRFPSPNFLRYLVSELGYDPDAAFAAFGSRMFRGRPDRRRKIAVGGADDQAERAKQKRKTRDYQRLDSGDNLYVPTAPTRRTLTGGGFTEAQVQQGLSKMRCPREMKDALVLVVYKRESPQKVAEKYGFSRAKLDVYASRLRGHIRNAPRPNAGTDLHVQENLSLYSQQLTYPSVKNLDLE